MTVKYKIYYKSGRTRIIPSDYGVSVMRDMYKDDPKVKKITGILPSGKEKPIKLRVKKRIKIKVSNSDIIARQQKRSSRARKLDSHKTAKRIVEPDEYHKWLKHPNRYDILGVDTAV